MARKYSTTIKVNGSRSSSGGRSRKTSSSRSSRNRSKSKNKFFTFGSWRGQKDANQNKNKNRNKKKSRFSLSTLRGKPHKGKKNRKVAKVFYTVFAIFALMIFFGGLVGLAALQELTKSLPDPERPFQNEKFKTEASIMYDRNGKELYRLFGDDNRDILKMKEDQVIDDVVPPSLKWSFLAAEDIDFYEHPGFDVPGIVRCGLRYVTSGEANCGASTITQQVVKLAALEDNTRSMERKIKELVLSLQLENQINDKDAILLLYMNIVPEGGNLYGVQTAAKYYFGKDNINDLTLAESVIIAAIPNNPNLFAPGRSYNPAIGEKGLENRRNIILDNMWKYKDKINQEVREYRESKAEKEGRELTEEEKKDYITEEVIKEARETEIEYKEVQEDITAPHFVFFSRNLLTERGYNNGEPFTLQQINTGGYKIYTTLDLDMQAVALDVVQNVAVAQYGARYGNKNAAMMMMVPKTGEIITMVGSKCYNNKEMAGCKDLDEAEGKLFDPQVNILTSEQQPGSSIKPFAYYLAYKEGILTPGSQIVDYPIEIGNYKPKNSSGDFRGVMSVRHAIVQSRNIPAILALMTVGPSKLAELKAQVGHTVNIDPAQYGPSAALGSQDVYAVEHANAYATFANGGAYVPYEAILKIEDSEGNIIYNLHGQNKPEAKQILDEKAVYMINDSTNPKSGPGNDSPVKWSDNRDMSGKTGTSEENRDNWFVNYSPDFVTVGWAGNNDNTRMAGMAFGSTNAEPWVREYMKRIVNTTYVNKRTPYNRPGGIAQGRICNKVEMEVGETREMCEGNSDYYIEGLMPPVYIRSEKEMVCVDQTNKLARDIDKNTGNAVEREFKYIKLPDMENTEVQAALQKQLDEYLKHHGNEHYSFPPTETCDVNRSPNGQNPWAEVSSPTLGSTHTDKISAVVRGYSPTGTVTGMKFFLAGNEIGSTKSPTFQGDLAVPNGMLSGTYSFVVKVTDNSGRTGQSSVQIKIEGETPDLSVVAPTDGSTKPVGTDIQIVASYSNGLSDLVAYVQKDGGDTEEITMTEDGSGQSTATWQPLETGTYYIWVKSTSPGVFESAKITIVVD